MTEKELNTWTRGKYSERIYHVTRQEADMLLANKLHISDVRRKLASGSPVIINTRDGRMTYDGRFHITIGGKEFLAVTPIEAIEKWNEKVAIDERVYNRTFTSILTGEPIDTIGSQRWEKGQWEKQELKTLKKKWSFENKPQEEPSPC